MTVCLLSLAQDVKIPGDSLFERKLLLEDIQFLRERIVETHVDPYIYTTGRKMDAAYSELKSSVTNGLSYYEFARQVSIFLRTMKDSHTFVDYGSLLRHYASENGYFTAFTIMYTNDGMTVVKDETGEIPPGAVISKINGVAADSLFESVKDFAVSEGLSEKASQRIAEATFPIITPLFQPLDSIAKVCYELDEVEVCVDYRTRTRKQIKELRKLQADKEKEEAEKSRFDRKHGDVYKLSIADSASFAILKVASFTYRGPGLYERFIKRSFKELEKRGIHTLAIDLRDNTGGHSNRAELLLGYLDGENAIMPANIISRQSPLAMERYKDRMGGFARFMNRLFHGRSEEFRNYTAMMDLEMGETDTVFYKEAEVAKKYIFEGPKFLWINGRSASASVAFTSVFQDQEMGKVLGEEPLGPKTGTWGNPVQVSLPNTGMVINLSTIRFNADNSFVNDPYPIQPNLEINYTREDLAKDQDPYLRKTLELVYIINTVR